ncbi:MAG: molybdopterin-guanine dinucleotide biosynthesis protein B [Aquificae bacterium]|nr:molybdopterin-guanine dinucleotide biosynthesis protein B [Aquificota bacterium]
MKFPAIIIVGAHNSGKTTFIEKVIKLLTEKGYTVTAVKHDPKGKAKTDTEGKDSWKMYNAGAKQVILASPNKITSYIRPEVEYNPEYILENLILGKPDIVIFEGFKQYSGIDKFEVIRKEENRELISNPSEIKGVITDYYKFPIRFDINQPEEFVKYIEEKYIKSSSRRTV